MRTPLPIRLLAVLTLILMTLLLGACGDNPGSAGPHGDGSGATLAAREGFEVLDWDDLLPPDWQPEALLEELEVENIPDDDPRAVAIMEQIMELWNAAPTVPLLAGRRISLTGFLVPLDFESDVLSEFLLIPYYGGCIHVPPPPANQTIHVVMPEGQSHRAGVFDVVRVSGTLRIESYRHEIAVAAYRIDAEYVEHEQMDGLEFGQPVE
ncbi:DUF3299 domain-containing protein [Allochromatium palmeri]|uniref:DUF3299 domain-containing protein n=1 Tax=Allochromatium palmeri TaxID=231048 RepID=A0A6N8EF64_9GAMM|nr:DUF3299 domain-containing protein [Allochromatium palmeri]MTW22942.1 DUF3299 domain-containing protein [Allochromatium palmeri]